VSGGDDWAPGDLALCVRRDGGGKRALPFTQVGATYTVTTVVISPLWPAAGLGFESLPVKENDEGVTAYDSRCFRKIHPLTDEERDEFLADLRTPAKQDA
jgi:hypothetical protein